MKPRTTYRYTCQNCGEPFTATRKGRMYCSRTCGKRSAARTDRLKHPGKNGQRTGFIGMSARKSFEWYEKHVADPKLAAFAAECKESAEW